MKEIEELARQAVRVYVGFKLFDLGVIVVGWIVVIWLFVRLVGRIETIFGL